MLGWLAFAGLLLRNSGPASFYALLELAVLVVGVALLVLFLLPSIIAVSRRHTRWRAIVLANTLGSLLLGVGWFIALAWCLTASGNAAPDGRA